MHFLARHALTRCLRAVVILGVLAINVGCADPPTGPPTPPSPDALSVLFVGNSLTYWNDMPAMLEGLLAESNAGLVVIATSAFPNYGLQDHWIDARTRDAIALGGWDYVVLQQGPSATEGRPSLLEYTDRFDVEIEAISARTAHLMVWPESSRSFDFDGVAASYAMASAAVDGLLFPAGESWRAAWRVDPSLDLYGSDGFHPSVLGSYLTALTVADRLVGLSLQPSYIIDTPSVQTTISAEVGDLLLAAAREANAKYP